MELLKIMVGQHYDKNGDLLAIGDSVFVDFDDGPEIGIVQASNKTQVWVTVTVSERKTWPFIANDLEKVEKKRRRQFSIFTISKYLSG